MVTVMQMDVSGPGDGLASRVHAEESSERPRVAERVMVEGALLEFDLIQSLLAAKNRHEAQNALGRLRRRVRELPSGERQQGRALFKQGAQLLRDFDKQIALEKRAQDRRRLLTAKCTECRSPGSEARLTNDSGRVLCLTCHKKHTVKCTGCGRSVFSKVQRNSWSSSPLCDACRQMPKCTKCGNPFKLDKSNSRQRVCAPCGGGQRPSLRTVSGGLPTLGHRR